MLISLSLIIIIGFSLKGIFQKIKLPGLLGMLLTGIILGPFVLDLMAPEILGISSDLRKIALIVILARAGMAIDLKDLKKVGRPAILMCFLPATFEIAGVMLLAPLLLGISLLDAAILGSVLGAVSPAVIVPRMLQMMENGKGQENRIPQLIMAGASVDDIFCITVFTALMGLHASQSINVAITAIRVPAAILSGLVLGFIFGWLLVRVFKAIHMRDTVKVLIILGISFSLVGFEDLISRIIPFSGTLAVMALSGTILKTYELLAKRLTGKFGKIWVAAELLLFVLIGTAVDVRYAFSAGLMVVIVIIGALLFRAAGVLVSLLGSPLTRRERLFCIVAYLPKATVQAAIGAIPLAAGLTAGNAILTSAVLAILITAPIGAVGIDLMVKGET